MKKHRIPGSAVVLLTAAGLLAGCGSDDEQASTPQAAATTPAAVATTTTATTPEPTETTPEERAKVLSSPQGKWATTLCDGLAKRTLTLQPPSVSPTDPKATQKSLVGFFDQVGDQLDGQLKVMREAGDPPVGQDVYDRAFKRLKRTKRTVAKLQRSVEAANPSNPTELTSLLQGLGKQMQAIGTYGGPIVDLANDSKLQRVLAAEPACAKFT